MKNLLLLLVLALAFVSCKDEIIPPCECIKTTYEAPLNTQYSYSIYGGTMFIKTLGVEKVICQDATKSVLPYNFAGSDGVLVPQTGVVMFAPANMTAGKLVYYRITCKN